MGKQSEQAQEAQADARWHGEQAAHASKHGYEASAKAHEAAAEAHLDLAEALETAWDENERGGGWADDEAEQAADVAHRAAVVAWEADRDSTDD